METIDTFSCQVCLIICNRPQPVEVLFKTNTDKLVNRIYSVSDFKAAN